MSVFASLRRAALASQPDAANDAGGPDGAPPADALDGASGRSVASRRLLLSAGLPQSSQVANAYEVTFKEAAAGARAPELSGVDVEVVDTVAEEVRTLQYSKAQGGRVVGVEQLSTGEVVVAHENGRMRTLQVRCIRRVTCAPMSRLALAQCPTFSRGLC